MRILITGANGFSGRHLFNYLHEQKSAEVFGTDVTPQNPAQSECVKSGVYPGTNFFRCDLADQDAVTTLIEYVAPNQIYHLAGTFSNNFDTDYAANVTSSRHLLESIRQIKTQCRILLIGSSAEYGLVPLSDNPVLEDHPLFPVSIYGLTKVYQTYLGKYYFAVHKLDVMTARPFNLLGRGISPRLFVGHVYQQVEAYRCGKTAKISVGNLNNRRDYISVEDAVRSYALIMQRGLPGEIYNVGSGISIQMRALLQKILAENGLGMEIVEEHTSAANNKLDVSDLFADITKLRSLLNG